MARPTLFTHPKFRRLCHDLGLSRPTALGHMELLWRVAYESGEALIGDATDVELAAEWDGEAGVFAATLVRLRFVDERDGGLAIHDLADHEPEYVKDRRKKERQRRAKGVQERELTRHQEGRERETPGIVPGTSREVPAGTRCAVCTHEKRDEIDRASGAGGTSRDIAERFGLSKSSVHRHMSHAELFATEEFSGVPGSSREVAGKESDLSGTPAPAPAPAPSKSAERPPDRFPEFWELYPKKADKLEAAKAWKKLSADDQTAALEKVSLYAKAMAGKTDFVKNAQGWLNGRRWEDDPATWGRNGSTPQLPLVAHPSLMSDAERAYERERSERLRATGRPAEAKGAA